MSSADAWRESQSATVASSVLAEDSEALLELVHRLGIESIRAASLDPDSLEAQAIWSMSRRKEPSETVALMGTESSFIAARDASLTLRDAPADYTMVRKLSPRLWSFAWMASPDQMLVVEARFFERRDALDDRDSVLVRLILRCLAHVGDSDAGRVVAGVAELSWTGVDRRRRQNLRSRLRAEAVPLLLLGLGTLLTCWMLLVEIPAATQDQASRQAENARLQAMADQTVIQHLVAALVAGDYGLLQDELAGFHSLSYFPRAVVVNARQQVVARVGMGADAPIGATAPATMELGAQAVSLTAAGSELGRLHYEPRSAPKGDRASMTIMKMATTACALTGIAAGVFLVFPRLKRRR